MWLREITVYVFKYGVGGHFWAAILDLKVKMVSENVKNHSVTFLMPELRRAVHSSHQFFGEVTNQVTNFKSPIFLFQVTKMCYIIQLR